ncbi:hypothetical protein [Pseudozobellia thermophila]|uniref:Uncharacterized protein n=1 Tax=Pseudozobellia thermophila TaxID=192903 RepID=A0A1M6MAQ4_9FLAO|nr:hypothetical protein [Pseudozobellia thermophila]SHJ80539.1 hypothetical protein SAMN04488513_10971 [Pseudozobellia thermophila]
MKKFILAFAILCTIAAMGSCSTDDSNDIDLIKPGDTVIVGKVGYSPDLRTNQAL